MTKRIQLATLSPLLIEALQRGQEVVLTVSGDSMRPTLRHQWDRVCLVGPARRCPRRYEVILCVQPSGRYLLHRIVGVGLEGYVLLGDHQLVKQYPISPEQILGVVKGFWRGEKYVDADELGYRLYCQVWIACYPLRCLWAKAWRLLVRGARLISGTIRREARRWVRRRRSET